MAPWSS